MYAALPARGAAGQREAERARKALQRENLRCRAPGGRAYRARRRTAVSAEPRCSNPPSTPLPLVLTGVKEVLCRDLDDVGRPAAPKSRARRESSLPRPHGGRFTSFDIVICSSVCPFDDGDVIAARTAARTWDGAATFSSVVWATAIDGREFSPHLAFSAVDGDTGSRRSGSSTDDRPRRRFPSACRRRQSTPASREGPRYRG